MRSDGRLLAALSRLADGGAVMDERIAHFMRESLAIEGIYRDPTEDEMAATKGLLSFRALTVENVCQLQAVYAPRKPLRTKPTMNVRVGNHIAPQGGPRIERHLRWLLESAEYMTPYELHHEFETLHPFLDGNGRTGRAVWAWHMVIIGDDPFALSFLHRWYYQSLEASR